MSIYYGHSPFGGTVPKTEGSFAERVFACRFAGCGHTVRMSLPGDMTKQLVAELADSPRTVAIESMSCPGCTYPELDLHKVGFNMYMALLAIGGLRYPWQECSRIDQAVDVLAAIVQRRSTLSYTDPEVSELITKYGQEYIIYAWLHLSKP